MSKSVPVAPDFHKVLFAAKNNDTVSGHTHAYYRYPGRFSPSFARAVIEEFSKPGDTILDPFLGGGTTLVEGLALNRRVIGIDLNPISVFVSTVKSTPLSRQQLKLAKESAKRSASAELRVHTNAAKTGSDMRFVNTPWWLRGTISSLLTQISHVKDRKVRAFLQCALLRTSQWALDCRGRIPKSSVFTRAFERHAEVMFAEMEEFSESMGFAISQNKRSRGVPRCILLRSAVGLEQDTRIPQEWLPVKLVLTSPPYPGVHILYHRWQVRGRRETPAPYAIIGSPDGHGPSYFTLGGRHQAGLTRYFHGIRECYSSVAKVMGPQAFLVQLVSVANQSLHLGRLLESIRNAGFEEYRSNGAGQNTDDANWRTVPHRKWYTQEKREAPSGRELLLLHKLKVLKAPPQIS